MLEQEKAQKDADIKILNVEVQALQKEVDAINSTLQQLEYQKSEAQKRLDELDDKVSDDYAAIYSVYCWFLHFLHMNRQVFHGSGKCQKIV